MSNNHSNTTRRINSNITSLPLREGDSLTAVKQNYNFTYIATWNLITTLEDCPSEQLPTDLAYDLAELIGLLIDDICNSQKQVMNTASLNKQFGRTKVYREMCELKSALTLAQHYIGGDLPRTINILKEIGNQPPEVCFKPGRNGLIGDTYNA